MIRMDYIEDDELNYEQDNNNNIVITIPYGSKPTHKRLSKDIARKIAELIEKDMLRIAPTLADIKPILNKEVTMRAVATRYELQFGRDDKVAAKRLLGAEFMKISKELTKGCYYISMYILNNMKSNSNMIFVDEHHVMAAYDMGRKQYYECINKLLDEKVIYKTTRQNVYVVNHNMLLKGDMNTFIANYVNKYGNDIAEVDTKGRIILK